MRDVRDQVLEYALVALRHYPVRALATAYAQFVLSGEERAGTPFTAVYEGAQGTGKTTYAVYTLVGTLLVFTAYIFEKSYLEQFVSISGFPAPEKFREFNPEVYNICKALYEGDFDAVVKYVRGLVAFGPFEFAERAIKLTRSGRMAPCVICDDAGIFFFRSGWLGYGKEWRRAVVKLTTLLQLLRSYTAGLIATTPRRTQLFTRFEEVLDHVVLVSKGSKTYLSLPLGGKVVTLVTDRYAEYHVKVRRRVGQWITTTLENITPHVSGGSAEPIFIPPQCYREIIRPILKDVWETRRKWIETVAKSAEEEIKAGLETFTDESS